MEIIQTIERFIHKPDWTLSRCYVQGKLFCFGVEDEKRDKKVHGETRIPEGTYLLGLRQSPKFSDEYWVDKDYNLIHKDKLNAINKKVYTKPHDLIWVKDVPGFEFILEHWGNTDLDSHGCYIVGDKIGVVKTKIDNREGVLNSRNTYIKLYKTLAPLVAQGNKYVQYKSI